MRDENRELGYDKEEEYFYRQNKELLDRGRAALDAKRHAREAEQLKAQHWLRCPKCGQEMREEERGGIKLERCTGCGGVFFDAGELELLVASEEPQGFFAGLRKRLRG